jgi:hypothetical protein
MECFQPSDNSLRFEPQKRPRRLIRNPHRFSRPGVASVVTPSLILLMSVGHLLV